MTAPSSKIPWYRPTFRRGLFALLAFEMFLLLAERCRWLGLVNNRDITDAQLRHLKGLAQLRWLELLAPRVTDEAVKELQEALPHCQIDR